jgi:hypothetical protein
MPELRHAEHEPRLRKHLPAVALFVILTFVVAWPLVRGVWDTIANYGDPLLNTWILAWDAHGLTTQPAHLFDANIFYPYPATLAYSEHLLGIAIPAAPVQWATGNAIFVHNLAILMSFVLAACGAYLLVYYLTGSRFAGVVAGLAYGFAGYRFTEFGQLQNLAVQWLPFTFLYLTRLCRTRAWRDAALFGLFFILQSWSDVYYFFYTSLAVGLYLAFRAYLGARARGLRPDWALVRRLAVSLGVAAVLMAAVFLPYLTARAAVGDRPAGLQDGAALQEYLKVPAGSLLGRLIPGMALEPSQGKTYFPGFVALALAAAAFVSPKRPSREDAHTSVRPDGRERFFYLLLAVVALVLSLGPTLRVRWDGGAVFSPLPYTALLRWVPGFTAMRVPARMAMLVIFACAILGGYGAAYLAHRMAKRSRPTLSLAILSAVLLLEILGYLALPQSGLPMVVGAQTPPVYGWLKQQPQNAVVLELPAMSSYWAWNDPLAIPRLARQEYFSTYHWRPTILGYSGFYPPLYQETINFLLNFPSSETLSYLRGLDVRFVVLHADQFEPPQWDAVAKRLPVFADQLQLVQQFGQDYVYALPEAVVDRRPTQLDLVLPQTVGTEQDYVAYITVNNPRPARLAQLVAEKYQLTYQWGGDAAATVSGVLPLSFPAGVSVIPVALGRPPQATAALHVTLSSEGRVIEKSGNVQVKDGGPDQAPPGGAHYHFYRAGLNFGGQLILQGVAFDAQQYHPGDSLALTFAWSRKADAPVGEYVINCDVQDAQQKHVAGGDMPLPGVDSWQPGQTITVLRLQQLPLDLPPGPYQVTFGLYNVTAKSFVPVIASDGTEHPGGFRTQITIQ